MSNGNVKRKFVHSPNSVRTPRSENSPNLERKSKKLDEKHEIYQELMKKIETLCIIIQKQEKEIESLQEKLEEHKKNEKVLQRVLVEFENRELELKTELDSAKLLNSHLQMQNKNLSKLLVSHAPTAKEADIESPKRRQSPKFNFNRLKIPDKLEQNDSLAEPLTARCEVNYRTVCREVMKVLGVKDVKGVVDRVISIKESSLKGRKCRKMLEKILDVILQSGHEEHDDLYRKIE